VLRTGVPWRDLPAEYGPWSSVYTRWRRWCGSGLWTRLLAELGTAAFGEIRSVDCSHIKIHQDAANPAGGQSEQAMGRTKGCPASGSFLKHGSALFELRPGVIYGCPGIS
jgi:transposase